ncbi:phage tail tube protein [Thioclava kandeliae]|uniref:Phage tail tube protein n=1 Tax=Thioclava kandeliae TaxID=3070818 RepID=A0ABV1SIE3_9RHOB
MSVTGVAIGYGVVVRIGRGATPTWTTLVGVGDLEMPNGEADEIEASSHSSPNRTKEFIPGLQDNGTLALPLDYIPDSDQDVMLLELNNTSELIQLGIKPPGGTEEIYAAWVKSYPRSLPVNGKAAATLNLRVNGLVEAEGA